MGYSHNSHHHIWVSRHVAARLIGPLSHLAVMSEITREVKLDPSVVPPLDPSVLTLSDTEKAFLHEAITPDDDRLRAKLLEVQKL